MIYAGFDVFDNDGNLIETLPAILVGGGDINVSLDNEGNPKFNTIIEILIQVPSGVQQIDITNIDTGEIIATVPTENGKGILEIDYQKVGTLRLRVGKETKTKLNEVVITGYVS